MNSHPDDEDDFRRSPGTVALIDSHQRNKIKLVPVPSSHPDDPLNWRSRRKAINFGLVCFYVLWTFVQLDIGFTAWGPMIDQLNMSIDILNASVALNYAGLAIGCIFFIPFVHKYGRRPLYIFSTAVQFLSCIWQAEVYTTGDILGSNLVSGLGGAISETIVQITIADVFFVHQHATMNGWYLAFTTLGAFLGPVASGFIVDSQGWRWTWWWCVIFLGVTFIAVLLFFEESKFISALTIQDTITPEQPATDANSITTAADANDPNKHTGHTGNPVTRIQSHINRAIKPKTYTQRMALVTKTSDPILHHFWQPVVVLFTFPAVTYTAITYGTMLAFFAILTSVSATYLLLPPYNFDAVGVGLMNLPPFIGACFGFGVGGWLNDKSIVWLAKKNNGIFEPEMRLWMALPGAIIIPVGILMFGVGLNNGAAWPLLAVGCGLFGFGFIIVNDICLSYCTDCYHDIVGDALVGVVFTRNALAVVVLFLLTPWVEGMGLTGVHVLIACLSFAILMLPALFLKHGKKYRIKTATRYREYALKQQDHRMI